MRRHLRAAYAVALAHTVSREDAEDVCQDAFITVLERLEQCRDPEKFVGWLLQIVRNRARDMGRYRAIRDHDAIDDKPIASSEPTPSTETERAELRDDLIVALETLTESQREVVLLHDLEGWKHTEIAHKLDLSPGTCRYHLHNGRKALRERLSETHTTEVPQ